MRQAGRESRRTGGGSLESLYAAHAHEAMRLANLMTGDLMLAEDLVQDAFVRVAGRLGHLRRPDRFEAYLRQTIMNLARMHFRRKKIERAYAASLRPEAQVPGPDTGSKDAIVRALAVLPVKQRAAIVLRFYSDLPDGETAEILGCRIATVRSLVYRGIGRLREALTGSEVVGDG